MNGGYALNPDLTDDYITDVQSGQYNFAEESLLYRTISISKGYFAWLCCALIFFIFRYCTAAAESFDAISFFVITAVLFGHLYRKIVIHNDFFSPDVFFVVFFYAFHFPALPMQEWNIVQFKAGFHLVPFVQYLNPAFLFSCICMVSFLIGYESTLFVPRQLPLYPIKRLTSVAVTISQMIFLIAVIMMVCDVLRSDGKVLSVQYENSMYTEGKKLFIFWSMGLELSRIGIFLYCASSLFCRGKLFQGWVMPVVVLLYMILIFMSGKRAAFLMVVLPPLFLHYYFRKKIKRRWIISLALIFVFVAPALRYMREDDGSYSISRFFESFEKTENPIIEGLAETGGTYRVVNATMYYSEKYNACWWGRSYYLAPVKFFPYLEGWLGSKYSTSNALWITLVHQRGGAGMGGSIAQEAYLNFGAWGFLILLPIGMLYRIVYEKATTSPTFFRTIIFTILTLLLFRWVRGGLYSVFRPAAWAGVIALIFQKVCADNNR